MVRQDLGELMAIGGGPGKVAGKRLVGVGSLALWQ